MAKINFSQIVELSKKTELFIKVFGSGETFKIANWLVEMFNPETIRHSKLSAFIKEKTTNYPDKRYFWGKKDASTGFEYKPPTTPGWHDSFLRSEIPVPHRFTNPDSQKFYAEAYKKAFEAHSTTFQVKYNPLTSEVYTNEAQRVRGQPKPGAEFAKKQPVSLLPCHLRTEFYHRTQLSDELTFHVGFLFDKNLCDLKEEKYFFPFDAWTWAQWWILPSIYAKWNDSIIPPEERKFLPHLRVKSFFAEQMKHVLSPARMKSESLLAQHREHSESPTNSIPSHSTLDSPECAQAAAAAAGAGEHQIGPLGRVPSNGRAKSPSPEELAMMRTPPRSRSRLGSSGGRSLHSPQPSESPQFHEWHIGIPFVHEAPGLEATHRRLLREIKDLRHGLEEDGVFVPPTREVRRPRAPTRLFDLEKGYDLIFKSLGYEGLKGLINNVEEYASYFMKAFHIHDSAHQKDAELVNHMIKDIAFRMVQLNRLLLHNEILVAPSPASLVGICLIPSRPLPKDFNIDNFYHFTEKNNAAFKAFQIAFQHKTSTLAATGNDIPIMMLDSFSGILVSLDDEEAPAYSSSPSRHHF